MSLRSTPGYVPSSLRDAGRARVDKRVRVDGKPASSVLPLPAGEGRGEGEHASIIPVFARPRRSSFPPSPHSSPAGRGGRTRPIGKRMKRRSHPARPTPGYVPSSLRDAGRARVDKRVRVDGKPASSVLALPAGEGRGEGEHAPMIPVSARPRRSSFSPSPHSSPAGRGGQSRRVSTH